AVQGACAGWRAALRARGVAERVRAVGNECGAGFVPADGAGRPAQTWSCAPLAGMKPALQGKVRATRWGARFASTLTGVPRPAGGAPSTSGAGFIPALKNPGAWKSATIAPFPDLPAIA